MLKLMKIFEVLWLAASAIALTMAIIRGVKGEVYGNYIYITIFTAAVAAFMYWFKRKNRLYLEERQRQQQEQASKS